MRTLRDNWIGLIVLLAIAISLAVNFHQTSVNEKARREAAISQSQFNLRVCARGAELRDQGNKTARIVNALKANLFTITKAASDVSGDPDVARARYGALADQIRALPEIPDLPPTDCAAVVKLYSPHP